MPCGPGTALLAGCLALGPVDTVRVTPMAAAPAFDGVATAAKWGAPTLTIATAGGAAPVWLRRAGAAVFIAVRVPDTTASWVDAIAISLDPLGDATPGPGHDDMQWEFRRVLDSSVVFQGRHGRWMPPTDDPDWRLGAARSGGGWEVRSASDGTGWSVELRLEAEWLTSAPAPRLAIRVYNDGPAGWWTWPAPTALGHPAELERRPPRWGVVGS